MNLEQRVEELEEHVLYLMQTCEKLALKYKGSLEIIEKIATDNHNAHQLAAKALEALAEQDAKMAGRVGALEGDVESLSHNENLWGLVEELTHNLAKRFGVSAVDVLYMPPRP